MLTDAVTPGPLPRSIIIRQPLSAALLYAAAFAALLLSMDPRLNMFDEGIVLVGAMRVTAGDLVHRDFLSVYGPGAYWCVALAWKLFGMSLIVARLYGIAVMAGIVAALVGLLRLRVRRLPALLGGAACLAWLISQRMYLYPSYPCLLLALVGTRLLIGAGWSSRRIALAGVCTGAAALFRYDAGFLILVAHVSALSVDGFLAPDARRYRTLLVAISVYGSGVAILFLPPALAFLSAGGFPTFYADIVDYGRQVYPVYRSLPLPGPTESLRHSSKLAVYLPILGAALCAPRLLADLKRTDGTASAADVLEPRYTLLFFCLTLVLFREGLVRATALHMITSIVMALPLLVITFCSRRNAVLVRAMAICLAVLPALLSFAAYARLRHQEGLPTMMDLLAGGEAEAARDREQRCAAGSTAFADVPADYAEAASFLASRSAADERIFIGLKRHDRMFVNANSLYFLAGRLPGTRWHSFEPGLQTERPVQATMIADLRKADVRWFVRDGGFDWVVEPNGSGHLAGSTLLDGWLDRTARPVASFGSLTVLLRRDTPLPPPRC